MFDKLSGAPVANASGREVFELALEAFVEPTSIIKVGKASTDCRYSIAVSEVPGMYPNALICGTSAP